MGQYHLSNASLTMAPLVARRWTFAWKPISTPSRPFSLSCYMLAEPNHARLTLCRPWMPACARMHSHMPVSRSTCLPATRCNALQTLSTRSYAVGQPDKCPFALSSALETDQPDARHRAYPRVSKYPMSRPAERPPPCTNVTICARCSSPDRRLNWNLSLPTHHPDRLYLPLQDRSSQTILVVGIPGPRVVWPGMSSHIFVPVSHVLPPSSE